MEEKSLIRSFICIDFPDEIIKEVARVQEQVGKKLFIGKLTELGNLHLTLKFLGEIEEEKINHVKEILKKIKFRGFEAKLGEIGVFCRRKNPAIVWIKILGKELWDLQSDINADIKKLLSPEERFMAHITLARIKYVNDKIGFINHIKRINVKDIKFRVNSFRLMSSQLGQAGPTYTLIEEYKLD